ncbi:MAG: hypothetical protein K6E49_05605 [Lachnospiraceae bacterium]|nr:hypothetical protein [Lachnospiraceae bacterium]
MQVGAVSMAMPMPYVYNTNTVNRASMNKIQPIEDDLLEAKTDFSGLTEEENTNPLAVGETKDFATVLDMQMQMSAQNAARLGLGM